MSNTRVPGPPPPVRIGPDLASRLAPDPVSRGRRPGPHRQFLILGFHRSGTSLLTNLLHSAGLFVGDDLLGANPSNRFGHYEDTDVIGIHDRILRDNAATWMLGHEMLMVVHPNRWDEIQQFAKRRREHHDVWGFKDPRTCLFIPVWRHVLPEMRSIILFRHYSDSAYSLERRHATDIVRRSGPAAFHRSLWGAPDMALRMWLIHNRALLRYAREYPDETMVLSFDALAAGHPIVEDLNRRFRLGLSPTPTTSVFDATATHSRPHPVATDDEDLVGELEDVLADLRRTERASLRSRQEAST